MPSPAIREIAAGLQFPEGPIAMPDGSILLVEIRRGTLTRVDARAARRGGRRPRRRTERGRDRPRRSRLRLQQRRLRMARAQRHRRSPATSRRATAAAASRRSTSPLARSRSLYRRCGDLRSRAPTTSCSIRSGGFWFTDHGKNRARDRDRTGVFYARPDGSSIVEAIFPMDGPNGLGLSPAEDRLYVVETSTGRLFYWDLDGPGSIRRNPRSPNGGHFLAGVGGLQLFDSLAVDADGNVCVATIVNGGITVISPQGEVLEHVPMPRPAHHQHLLRRPRSAHRLRHAVGHRQAGGAGLAAAGASSAFG